MDGWYPYSSFSFSSINFGHGYSLPTRFGLFDCFPHLSLFFPLPWKYVLLWWKLWMWCRLQVWRRLWRVDLLSSFFMFWFWNFTCFLHFDIWLGLKCWDRERDHENFFFDGSMLCMDVKLHVFVIILCYELWLQMQDVSRFGLHWEHHHRDSDHGRCSREEVCYCGILLIYLSSFEWKDDFDFWF